MFSDILNYSTIKEVSKKALRADKQNIQKIIQKEAISLEDFAALLSPVAVDSLEEIAAKSHQRTIRRFGYTMGLYTPLYLSNACVNHCVYCSFQHNLNIERKTLSMKEIEAECMSIQKEGFSNILLVSGEHPGEIPLDYLKMSVKIAKKYFAQVIIEVYPLEESEYKELKNVGLDGVTLYQETYHPEKYPDYHPRGPKSDYRFRLNTMDRAGKAGLKKLNIGSLLGLNDWREEAVAVASHLLYLKKQYWESEVAVSFPRIRGNAGKFKAPYSISDIEMVQVILALRLLDEKAGLVLSTRESEAFRNGCLKLGITSMSAGSRTNPGGHIGEESGTQFAISDTRGGHELSNYLSSHGYDPVWKDWEHGI